MKNKYAIDENSELAQLAKQVTAIAAKRETQPNDTETLPPRETSNGTASVKSKSRKKAANRPLLFSLIIGAVLVIAVVSTVFGIKQMNGKRAYSIPDVVGNSSGAAATELKKAGFTVAIEYDNSSNKKAGTVIALVPASKTKLPAGSKVVMRVAGKAPTRRQAVKDPLETTVAKDEPGKSAVVVTPTNDNTLPGDQAQPQVAEKKLTIPTVDGMKVEEARKLLQDLGLKVIETTVTDAGQPNGQVLGSDPKAGTELPPGGLVQLRVSLREEKKVEAEIPHPAVTAPPITAAAELITIPDYTGATGQESVRDLRNRGLRPEWQYELNTHYTQGAVISTNPPAGSRVKPGSKVNLVLAK